MTDTYTKYTKQKGPDITIFVNKTEHILGIIITYDKTS